MQIADESAVCVYALTCARWAQGREATVRTALPTEAIKRLEREMTP